MNLNFDVKYHNRFDAVLTDAKTGEIKQIAKAENVVTNAFWNTFFKSQDVSYIAVGTGTGTISPNDTNLFNLLALTYIGVPNASNTHILDEHSYSIVRTLTVSESGWIGDLTEVGLCTVDSQVLRVLCTHALFTDSEGAPIVIHKTSTDKLTITVTVYITIEYDNPTNGITLMINKRNSVNYLDPRPTYCPGDSINFDSLIYPLFMLHCSYDSYSIVPRATTLVMVYQINQPSVYNYEAACSYDNTTKTARLKKQTRILSADANTTWPTTYLIKSLWSSCVQIAFPNATIYPARLFTLTQVADGNSTEFNFDIPILKTTDVKVYIDNILQSPSSYTFNGRNFTHIQAWDSADTLYLKRCTYYTSSFRRPSCVIGIGVDPNRLTSYYYDFGTDYYVTGVGKYLVQSGLSFSACNLYYSSDNENWQQLPINKTAAEWTAAPNITKENGIMSVIPTSARYWRVDLNVGGGNNISSSYLEAGFLFGNPTPQLKFNTAPPADSTITIEAYCEYPIKNENWIIESGMTIDLTINRQ